MQKISPMRGIAVNQEQKAPWHTLCQSLIKTWTYIFVKHLAFRTHPFRHQSAKKCERNVTSLKIIQHVRYNYYMLHHCKCLNWLRHNTLFIRQTHHRGLLRYRSLSMIEASLIKLWRVRLNRESQLPLNGGKYNLLYFLLRTATLVFQRGLFARLRTEICCRVFETGCSLSGHIKQFRFISLRIFFDQDLIVLTILPKMFRTPLTHSPCSVHVSHIRKHCECWYCLQHIISLLRYFKGKKHLIQISSRLPAYIYTCELCPHIRIHMWWDLVYLDTSGPSSVSSRPLGLHRVNHAQCVRACVYTNTYTHIHSHLRQKYRRHKTTPLSLLLLKITHRLVVKSMIRPKFLPVSVDVLNKIVRIMVVTSRAYDLRILNKDLTTPKCLHWMVGVVTLPSREFVSHPSNLWTDVKAIFAPPFTLVSPYTFVPSPPA